jgi:hypothetical protein
MPRKDFFGRALRVSGVKFTDRSAPWMEVATDCFWRGVAGPHLDRAGLQPVSRNPGPKAARESGRRRSFVLSQGQPPKVL